MSVRAGHLLKRGIGRIWREGSIGRREECSLFGLSRSESLVKGFSCLFHLTSQLQAVIYQLHMRLESPVKSTIVLAMEFYWVNARHNPVLITPICWLATLTHCAARNATPFIHLLRPVHPCGGQTRRTTPLFDSQ